MFPPGVSPRRRADRCQSNRRAKAAGARDGARRRACCTAATPRCRAATCSGLRAPGARRAARESACPFLRGGTMQRVHVRRLDLLGAAAGVLLGLTDTWLLTLTGVEMRIGGRDATLLVALTFASSCTLLGWL